MAEARRRELGRGAWLDLEVGFLDPGAADAALAALTGELSWERRDVVLFGRRIPQPRLIAWAGELGYRYSGQTLEPRAATPTLRDLLRRVAGQTGIPFNHLLVNRYRDGNDSMGMHADDEPELGPDPIVSTLSLGQTRSFLLRAQRRVGPERPLSLPLTTGSLLVMGGTCQRHYRHAVAREAGTAVGERVSLTFRRLLRAPA